MKRSHLVISAVGAALFVNGLGYRISAAETISAKAVFEKNNLMGTFALDCKQPASKTNLHYINRPLDNSRVQRDQLSGPSSLDVSAVIDTAIELSPAEIFLSGTRGNVLTTAIWRLEDDRTRATEIVIGGNTVFAEGKVVSTGQEVPWLTKCGR